MEVTQRWRSALGPLLIAGWLAGAAAAQTQPTSKELERAIAVEEVEHDAEQAAKLYRGVTMDAAASDAVRRRAWLRLGMLARAAGEGEAAQAALGEAAQGDDATAQRAKALMDAPVVQDARAQEIRERARGMIQRYLESEAQIDLSNPESNQILRDVIWLGPEAVPELIRTIQLQRDRLEPTVRIWHAVQALPSVVWKIGGRHALPFLSAAVTDADVAFRRGVARGIRAIDPSREELVAIAQRFLADSDPEGVVPWFALGGAFGSHVRGQPNWSSKLIQRLSPDSIFAAASHPSERLRTNVYRLIGSHWDQLAFPEPTGEQGLLWPRRPGVSAAAGRLAEALLRDVEATDPDLGRAAVSAFNRAAVYARPLRQRAIQMLTEGRSNLSVVMPRFAPADFAGSDDGAAAMLELLERAGPLRRGSPPHQSVYSLLWTHLEAWQRPGIPVVLRAMSLGYGDAPSQWFGQNLQASDAMKIIEALRGTEALVRMRGQLVEWDLPSEAWPILRRHLDERPEDFPQLAAVVGKTREPSAANWLVSFVASNPSYQNYEAMASGLHYLSEREPSDMVRTAMIRAVRKPLVEAMKNQSTVTVNRRGGNVRGNPERDSRRARSRLIGRLARMGDVRVWDHYAEFMQATYTSQPQLLESSKTFMNLNEASISWLTGRNSLGETWHTYEPTELVAIWSELMARRDYGWPSYTWRTLARVFGNSDPQYTVGDYEVPRNYRDVPSELVSMAARLWLKRLEDKTDELAGNGDLLSLACLLDMRRRGLVKPPAVDVEVGVLHARALQDDRVFVQLLALNMLPADLDEGQREMLTNAVSSRHSAVADRARELIAERNITISVELVKTAIRSQSAEVRREAINTLAPQAGDAVLPVIRKLLTDVDGSVRAAACSFIGGRADMKSVPALLEKLRDVDPDVREKAASALNAIRFFHDQQAHWDRVFAGEVEVTRDAAASKLIRQAGPENNTATRLLAIRSLGVLGSPESLPFLIEWSKDAKQNIADAASEAIAKILGSGK